MNQNSVFHTKTDGMLRDSLEDLNTQPADNDYQMASFDEKMNQTTH